MIRLPDPLPGNRPVSALRDCRRKDAWVLERAAPAVRWIHLIQQDVTMVLSAPVYFDALVWVCESKLNPPPPHQMCQTRATKLRWPVPVPLPAAVPAVQGEKAEQHHRKRRTGSCCKQRGASSKECWDSLHSLNHNIFIIYSKDLIKCQTFEIGIEAVYTCTVHTEKKNCFVSTQFKLLYHLGAKLLNWDLLQWFNNAMDLKKRTFLQRLHQQ